MSRAKKSFLIGYVFLVVLPVAALCGILKRGSGRIAPVVTDGLGKVEIHVSLPDTSTFLESLQSVNGCSPRKPGELSLVREVQTAAKTAR